MTWTSFFDMCSGGGRKEKFSVCVIEAPEAEAISVFFSRFGHNPNRVSCTCCGQDYSIDEAETFEDVCHNEDADVIIRAGEIMPHERTLDVPEQGYVWRE